MRGSLGRSAHGLLSGGLRRWTIRGEGRRLHTLSGQHRRTIRRGGLLPHPTRARRASDTVLTRGELALDGKGCLRTTRNADAGPQDLVPIWPSTSEPDTSGGEVRMLDGERVVALVGKVVEIGVRDRR